jgi:hypothetical protein
VTHNGQGGIEPQHAEPSTQAPHWEPQTADLASDHGGVHSPPHAPILPWEVGAPPRTPQPLISAGGKTQATRGSIHMQGRLSYPGLHTQLAPGDGSMSQPFLPRSLIQGAQVSAPLRG